MHQEHAHLMQYLAELCLLEVHMVQYVTGAQQLLFLHFFGFAPSQTSRPSLVAAASALLSAGLTDSYSA